MGSSASVSPNNTTTVSPNTNNPNTNNNNTVSPSSPSSSPSSPSSNSDAQTTNQLEILVNRDELLAPRFTKPLLGYKTSRSDYLNLLKRIIYSSFLQTLPATTPALEFANQTALLDSSVISDAGFVAFLRANISELVQKNLI
jgi:hypothetical protein